jgi:rubrerythrin
MGATMIDRESLRNLASTRSADGAIVSAFFSTSRLDDWRQTAPTFLNSESNARLREYGLGKDARRRVQDDVARIQEVLRYDVGSQTEGLAVFADAENGRFEQFELPFRLINRVVVQPTAYVRPLVHALSLLEPFVLVRVSRDDGMIYSVDDWHLTRTEEHAGPYLKSTDRETGDVPIKEYYAAARQETLVDQHFKDMATALDRVVDDLGAAHVVLAGQHDIVSNFRKALSARSAAKVVAETALDHNASDSRLIEGAREALAGARHAAMEELAVRITDGMGAGGRGVGGFDDTFAALRRSQVRTLLVDRHYRPPGWICPACEHVTLAPTESCPVCGEGMTPAADAVGEAVRLAVLNGAFVEVAEDIPALDALGGIGGLLRYA